MDLGMIIEQVKNILLVIMNIRINLGDEFKIIFDIFNIDANFTSPRITGTQLYRNDVPTDSPEQYHHTTIFISYLDYVFTDLNIYRFVKHNEIFGSF